MHKGFVTRFSFSGVMLAALCTASSVSAEPMQTGAEGAPTQAAPAAEMPMPPPQPAGEMLMNSAPPAAEVPTHAAPSATPMPMNEAPSMPQAQPPASAMPQATQTPSAAPDMRSTPTESGEPVREVSTQTVSLANGVDEGGRSDRLPNRKLLRTSGLVLAASYIPTFLVAMAKSKETSGALYAPVAGPFIEMGEDTSAGNRVLLFFSGMFQTLGAAGLVTSFFLPESRTSKIPGLGQRKVRVDAVASRSNYQLTLGGQF